MSRAVPRPAGKLLPACGAVVMALLLLTRLMVPIVRKDGPTAPITALAHVPAACARKPC